MLSIKYYGDKNNPLLVLLHGFLGSAKDWQPFIPEWSTNFYCAAVDLPGHGDSLVSNNKYIFTDVADMIIRTIGANKFYLLGYSMGGRIALDITKRYPLQVLKAICVSASPGIEDKQQAQKRYNRDKKLLQIKDKHLFLQQWYKQSLFEGIPEHKNYQQFIRRRQQGNFDQMQQGLNIMSVGKQPNMWPWLCTKDLPLLYVYGELDKKYATIAKRLEQTTQIQTMMFKNSSHMPHFQKPVAFMELVNKYFSQIN